ncbi:MAG: OsmC family protein [Thermoleophilia bacterium]
MPEETVHEVHVSLARERPPIRHAHLHMTGTDVTFGVPGWQGDHYGFAPGTVEEHPGTLDYLVASVGGCLIGTFGGACKVRDVVLLGDDLTADAVGEVVVEPDKVLRLRKITVTYHVKADEQHRETLERVNKMHVKACPNARSVMAAIEIETIIDLVPAEAPAASPA